MPVLTLKGNASLLDFEFTSLNNVTSQLPCARELIYSATSNLSNVFSLT